MFSVNGLWGDFTVALRARRAVLSVLSLEVLRSFPSWLLQSRSLGLVSPLRVCCLIKSALAVEM